MSDYNARARIGQAIHDSDERFRARIAELEAQVASGDVRREVARALYARLSGPLEAAARAWDDLRESAETQAREIRSYSRWLEGQGMTMEERLK